MSALKGELLFRGGDGYRAAREESLHNRRRPSRYPEAIVRSRCAEDVVAAVRLARDRGWRIDVRSGGHSWSGSHLHDGGLLVDLSQMTSCDLDLDAATASVEPGLRGSDFTVEVAEHGLFFPTGHCVGPCLGGFILQGGFGWNSRALGPACMSVTGIEAVTMDGERVVANERENPELFWASRGSGPGMPAIVTKFHLALSTWPAVQLSSAYLFSMDALDELMRWVHAVGPSIPNSIELMVFMRRDLMGHEGPGLQLLAPVLSDSEEQAVEDLAVVESCPLLERALTSEVRQRTDVRELVAHSAEFYPEGYRYAVDNMWTSADVEDLLPGYRSIGRTLPARPSHMMWMNWSPAAGPERPDMAYSLEDNFYIALYGVWNDGAEDDRFESWATERMEEMEHLSSGVQLADENLARRPSPFLETKKMKRLEAVRATYDPDGLLCSYNTAAPSRME